MPRQSIRQAAVYRQRYRHTWRQRRQCFSAAFRRARRGHADDVRIEAAQKNARPIFDFY